MNLKFNLAIKNLIRSQNKSFDTSVQHCIRSDLRPDKK